jgi:hypothetical protein
MRHSRGMLCGLHGGSCRSVPLRRSLCDGPALACKRHSISGFGRSVGAAAALGPLSRCSQVIGFASDVLDNWERVLEIHALYRPSSAKWHASSPHVMSMVVRHKRSGAMQARLVVVSPLRSACAWTAPPAQTCSHADPRAPANAANRQSLSRQSGSVRMTLGGD